MGKGMWFFSGLVIGVALSSVTGYGLYQHYVVDAVANGEGTLALRQTTPPQTASPPQQGDGADQVPTDIKLKDLKGHEHSFADWHGKLLLINFWATWCPPCRAELPLLAAAQKKYGDRGLQIVGPAVDDAATVKQDAPLMGIDYPVLLGSQSDMLQLITELGDLQGGLPYSVLVGPDGKILDRHLGAFQGKRQLEHLIEQHLPT
jgi:Thiol-disulfide isomerase and thioredoxins